MQFRIDCAIIPPMKDIKLTTTIVDISSASELDSFVMQSPYGHFLQTSFWGKVKHDWKWFGVICRRGEEVTGTLAVLLRKISKTKYRLMYAPRGPVCNPEDAETFSALINAAVTEGVKHNAYKLKIDKDIPADNESYKKMLLDEGFRFKKRTFGFENFQCRFVFRLNIENKSEEEVFASFHSKHRYNIRLADKKGVEVRVCGSEKAEEFGEIMKVTTERDGFKAPGSKRYAGILDSFGDDARLYMAYYDGKPIAGTLAVRCGDKVWFFYGGSLNSCRNLMPNYLLQWEMIKWAIESGCKIYDFRGVSGNIDENSPLYGLYRFKKGFNGDLVEFIGESDKILNPVADIFISVSQKIIRLFK